MSKPNTLSQEESGHDIHDLADKYLKGTLSDEERAAFERWYAGFDDSKLDMPFSRHPDPETLRSSMLKRITATIWPAARLSGLRSYLWPIAAALVLAISLFVRFSAPNEPRKLAAIVPGKDKAVLILADGKTIALDEAQNGKLAEQAGVSITKNDSGLISYNFSKAVPQAQNALNTIRTPRGGQFKLTLSDGTRIWLNADSYVRFPVHFSGNERKVEAGGEVYLEVAKDKRRHFFLQTGNQRIEVLGTSFNVSAYEDEPQIRTTLFEGSVNLTGGKSLLKLRPGQQAKVSAGGEIELDPEVDLEVVAAWKNGYFMFEKETIQSAMRKIGRWYDVDIDYQGAVPDDWLGGTISKYKDVREVLAKLELTGQFHFKVEGRRVTVMK